MWKKVAIITMVGLAKSGYKPEIKHISFNHPSIYVWLPQ
jgi:hypothetical protein